MPFNCKYGAKCEHPTRVKHGYDPDTGHSFPVYENGIKRCKVCNSYVLFDGFRCPCCNSILRTHAKNSESRTKNILTAARI